MLTVVPDGTVAEEKLKFLLEMRYDLTKGKVYGNIKL